MATSVYPAMGGNTNNTTAANFIPEIWSDEIIAAYKKELVIANLVNKMPMTGKKGDTIHIPKPTRGVATAKAANTAVTIQNETATKLTLSVNKHFEYSRMIEDITDIQAQASMRKFYTGDAGYALAKKVEDDIFLLGQSTQGGNGANWAKAKEIVYISNNCPVDGANKIGMLQHKDAFVLVEQMAVRSQTQYKQEFLADLFTSDTIYGTGVLRDTSAVAIALLG